MSCYSLKRKINTFTPLTSSLNKKMLQLAYMKEFERRVKLITTIRSIQKKSAASRDKNKKQVFA
ncbi:hypothetical protein SAMN04488589_2851 [Methanolobus vulcani]|uniref:Uncharacterized protein n=1 Tax=Methanolobus vulcani TaxID=38026 RepID=A0A7Z7AZ97_9EURY|nr:hypothetical protein SAMN04488589_2851 [Methanolobus vulcani]